MPDGVGLAPSQVPKADVPEADPSTTSILPVHGGDLGGGGIRRQQEDVQPALQARQSLTPSAAEARQQPPLERAPWSASAALQVACERLANFERQCSNGVFASRIGDARRKEVGRILRILCDALAVV